MPDERPLSVKELDDETGGRLVVMGHLMDYRRSLQLEVTAHQSEDPQAEA